MAWGLAALVELADADRPPLGAQPRLLLAAELLVPDHVDGLLERRRLLAGAGPLVVLRHDVGTMVLVHRCRIPR